MCKGTARALCVVHDRKCREVAVEASCNGVYGAVGESLLWSLIRGAHSILGRRLPRSSKGPEDTIEKACNRVCMGMCGP